MPRPLPPRSAILLGVVVFLLALVPRLWESTAYITTDEPAWGHRSAMFLTALREGRYADTLVVGHPGVTTMWLGSVGIAVQCRMEPAACEDLWLVGAHELDGYWDAPQMRLLPRWLPGVKVPLAIALSLGIAAAAVLAGLVFGRWVAVTAAAVLLMDPFLLAHTRVIHLDALTAVLMTVSLLALMAGMGARRWWPAVAASGALAALAALTKSSGLFLVPFAGLTVAYLAWRAEGVSRRALERIASVYGLWIAAAAVTLFAVWPAMWVAPLASAGRVLDTGIGYAREPHENLNFFLGDVRPDPGPLFYPVALALRLTPLTMIGVLSALLTWPRWSAREAVGPSPSKEHAAVGPSAGVRLAAGSRDTSAGEMMAVLVTYVVLFTLVMTVGAKKFDRYLLPVFPVLDLVAAVGLVSLAGLLAHALRSRGSFSYPGRVVGAILALSLAVQALHVASLHPYYLAYYNPAVGGIERAQRTVLVGWGEGLAKTAAYLNTVPDAQTATAAVWMVPSLAPFYLGETEVFFDEASGDADYLVFYISDDQRGFHATARERLGDQPPEHVVRIHGIEYARVYRTH